jgi:hypothetical protein
LGFRQILITFVFSSRSYVFFDLAASYSVVSYGFWSCAALFSFVFAFSSSSWFRLFLLLSQECLGNLSVSIPVLMRPVLMRPVLMRPVLMRPVLMRPVLMRPVLMRPVLMRPVLMRLPLPVQRTHRQSLGTASTLPGPGSLLGNH